MSLFGKLFQKKSELKEKPPFHSGKEKPKAVFEKRETVNGVEMEIGWDDGYGYYTIYFPQINLTEEAFERGVNDQMIIISEKEDEARKVFEYAKKVAESDGDIYSVYKKVDEFARSL